MRYPPAAQEGAMTILLVTPATMAGSIGGVTGPTTGAVGSDEQDALVYRKFALSDGRRRHRIAQPPQCI
jgi:hypothetical protein